MDDSTGSSTELSSTQCHELLATQTVGRIAFATSQGPRIVPVNFDLREGCIELHTTSYSELAVSAPDTTVAFEVDELDTQSRSGWSVVVVGTCQRVLDEELLAPSSPPGAAPSGSSPWAGGRRPLTLRIRPTQLTGRRVGHGEWHHPEAARA